jgi:hypothetical protein
VRIVIAPITDLTNVVQADAKDKFESISTIYIYSIQPNAVQDLNTLTDVSREIWTAYGKDDPLELGATWGMIQNRYVKVSLFVLCYQH